eukprot:CAMPEP_0170515622 /NCGR_PEP_ID=MMETSP0209-20121228/2037_1 /TAXON_ID=665100 ORGANISM="Litonotus pictus, Strain P1" /NCGR_SAMPLE_ID=MMETSP0209 /ASSEMBLY_ACC=CAM_ASM_000301 /LENGTH=82 /DNA_ID=CAMNT_0010800193 /DNA_START=857 /DNA_END=1105 /DNA_ORIENTATION=+
MEGFLIICDIEGLTVELKETKTVEEIVDCVKEGDFIEKGIDKSYDMSKSKTQNDIEQKMKDDYLCYHIILSYYPSQSKKSKR